MIDYLLYALGPAVLFIAICTYRDHRKRIKWIKELQKSQDNYVNGGRK